MDEVSQAIKQLRDEKRFFHLFSQEELALLFPLFGIVHYAAKSTVFAEEDTTNIPFFVVYNGALEINKKTDFGRPFVLARISRGSLMGQIAFTVSRNRATVSAITLEETDLLMMSADLVVAVLDKHPTIGIKLLREIIRVQNIRMADLVTRMIATL